MHVQWRFFRCCFNLGTVFDGIMVISYRVRDGFHPWKLSDGWSRLDLDCLWIAVRSLFHEELKQAQRGQECSRLVKASSPSLLARTVETTVTKLGKEMMVLGMNTLELDRVNGNTMWKDAETTELNQIDECKSFVDKAVWHTSWIRLQAHSGTHDTCREAWWSTQGTTGGWRMLHWDTCWLSALQRCLLKGSKAPCIHRGAQRPEDMVNRHRQCLFGNAHQGEGACHCQSRVQGLWRTCAHCALHGLHSSGLRWS